MRDEDIWLQKSDEEVLAAGARLEDYTEEGQRILLAEIARRQLRLEPSAELAPAPDDAGTGGGNGRGLLKLWRGGYPLAQAWWGWWVGGGLLWLVLLALALAALPAEPSPVGATLVGVLILLYASYAVVTLVGVWRSANRYKGRPLWATLAKVAVAANAARAVGSLIGHLGSG